MESFEKEKQKLISHIKNQQSILLFASQLSKQIEKSDIYQIIEDILVKTVGVNCFSLHIENEINQFEMAYSYGVNVQKKEAIEDNDFFLQTLSKSGITIYTKGSNFDELGSGIGISSKNENISPEVAITLRNAKKVIGILCIYSFKENKVIS